MQLKRISKFFYFFAWLAIGISIIFLIFGFGEDGFQILGKSEFWIIINSLWILAILFFIIGDRLNKK